MKKRIQKVCTGVGFTMLMLTGAVNVTRACGFIFLFIWLAAAIALLFAGKAFSFQQKR